jgi:tRNA threonylcarbamoyladenosine biosynthesis protein TsaE
LPTWNVRGGFPDRYDAVMKESFITNSGEETNRAGMSFAEKLLPGSVVCMHGPLGAGKTTFIQGVAKALGIEEAVTSPTFTIAALYEGKIPLYHIDAYRIDSTEEFEMLGLEEYIYGRGATFIEWAEKVQEVLPDSCFHITIDITSNGSREISVEAGKD